MSQESVEEVAATQTPIGRVVLAGTPVGNPADAAPRLRELIEQADIIAAEDTRRFRRLAGDLDVTYSANVVSFYEAVEREGRRAGECGTRRSTRCPADRCRDAKHQ